MPSSSPYMRPCGRICLGDLSRIGPARAYWVFYGTRHRQSFAAASLAWCVQAQANLYDMMPAAHQLCVVRLGTNSLSRTTIQCR